MGAGAGGEEEGESRGEGRSRKGSRGGRGLKAVEGQTQGGGKLLDFSTPPTLLKQCGR